MAAAAAAHRLGGLLEREPAARPLLPCAGASLHGLAPAHLSRRQRGLRFLGFEFNVGASQSAAAHAGPLELYRARFPTERTMSDLARWEQLEREKSNLFPGYAFICQKE